MGVRVWIKKETKLLNSGHYRTKINCQMNNAA